MRVLACLWNFSIKVVLEPEFWSVCGELETDKRTGQTKLGRCIKMQILPSPPHFPTPIPHPMSLKTGAKSEMEHTHARKGKLEHFHRGCFLSESAFKDLLLVSVADRCAPVGACCCAGMRATCLQGPVSLPPSRGALLGGPQAGVPC